jgi:SAM-dependent methyltransferase
LSEDPTAALAKVFDGLALHGPGDNATSRAVLAEVSLFDDATVVDMGCGPGRTTLLLAEVLKVPVVGIDRHRASLEALISEARRRRLPVRARRADMLAPGFGRSSIDLIWAEASAYAVGLEAALLAWRPLLGPGAQLVFSELCWTGDARPEPAASFWSTDYPAMRDQAGVEELLAACSYTVASFRWLPPVAWEAYYLPLEARLDALAAAGVDAQTGELLASLRQELAVWRSCGHAFGYGLWRVLPRS